LGDRKNFVFSIFPNYWLFLKKQSFFRNKNCKSVKKKINKLKNILTKNNINENDKKNIIDDYILELIPSSTKGVIRGNKFNKIIKEFILSLDIDKKRFCIEFEQKNEIYDTTEIPDWYIYDKNKDKIIIGMNQLDLWGGGHQLNRGSKYIINNINNTKKSKLLCVVCNNIIIKSNKNKIYKLFNVGFQNDTLCYKNNLKNIIFNYFNL